MGTLQLPELLRGSLPFTEDEITMSDIFCKPVYFKIKKDPCGEAGARLKEPKEYKNKIRVNKGLSTNLAEAEKSTAVAPDALEGPEVEPKAATRARTHARNHVVAIKKRQVLDLVE